MYQIGIVSKVKAGCLYWKADLKTQPQMGTVRLGLQALFTFGQQYRCLVWHNPVFLSLRGSIVEKNRTMIGGSLKSLKNFRGRVLVQGLEAG